MKTNTKLKVLLLSLFLLSHSLLAEIFVTATQSCEAFNDMKHKKNTQSQSLEIGKRYKVIDKKKEQYYIQVQGISIPNRWVNQSCFEPSSRKAVQTASTKTTQSTAKSNKITLASPMLLALSWQNAFCQSHQYSKECKRSHGQYSDTHFTLHGLWPQPRENIYCNVSYENKKKDKTHQWKYLPTLDLSPNTRKALLQIMPSSASNLQKHEWIKHGTCAKMTAENYYSTSIRLTQQFNNSKVAQLFALNIGKTLTLAQIRFKMNQSFGKGSGKKIELRCKNGLITELWLQLKGEG